MKSLDIVSITCLSLLGVSVGTLAKATIKRVKEAHTETIDWELSKTGGDSQVHNTCRFDYPKPGGSITLPLVSEFLTPEEIATKYINDLEFRSTIPADKTLVINLREVDGHNKPLQKELTFYPLTKAQQELLKKQNKGHDKSSQKEPTFLTLTMPTKAEEELYKRQGQAKALLAK